MQDSLDLKGKVMEELAKPNPNWALVEQLSRAVVDEATDKVRFSVDAGHIQRLGFELVARQETALSELIKNSYDADATRVEVSFFNHDTKHGVLEIRDNGSGMDLATVRDAWMRLSTANKVANPFSPQFRRTRAGRKGIGRFAVQRLGGHLDLETEVQGSTSGTRVIFDWDSEFKSGLHLSDIFSGVTTYEKPAERHGTLLRIRGLREKWSPAAIRRVWRAVLLLQPPFPVARQHGDLQASSSERDPGFEVTINGVSSRQERTTLGIDSSFLSHALAEISGRIDADGKAHIDLVSRRLQINESQALDQRFELTGPVNFHVHYFIYNASDLPGLSLNTAKEMGREFGGIRIYRNGFRVAPYGERGDDWLRLDQDTSRRVLLVTGANANFFGQVTLSAEDNPLFEETSSREGLLENEAFEELRHFVRQGVEWGIKRVAAKRERKQSGAQKDFVSVARPVKPSEVLDELVAKLSPQEGAEFSLSAARPAAIEDARRKVLEWEADVEQRQAQALQYEEMLRILASLGLSISVFGHEIKGMRSAVSAHVALLGREIRKMQDSTEKNAVNGIMSDLSSATARMFDLGGYIAGLMTSTESRELRSLSVKGAIERFVRQFSDYMSKQKIEFTYNLSRPELRTAPMHSSELDSALLNFLTNSIKSMKAAKVNPRRVHIEVIEDGSKVAIQFMDNGGGIPRANWDRIFDAFFTTSTSSDDDGLAGPGTGLGLKIVRDIALSYGGDAYVAEPAHPFTCNIVFSVPIQPSH